MRRGKKLHFNAYICIIKIKYPFIESGDGMKAGLASQRLGNADHTSRETSKSGIAGME
jgi:hypothetical protein